MITNKYTLPPNPQTSKVDSVYPWENTELTLLCVRLYNLAITTGYTGPFEDFKQHFGLYLESHNIFTTTDFETYQGQYEITPLPLVEQILQTHNKIVTNDIIIEPIPYAQTSNTAGGYTVTIG